MKSGSLHEVFETMQQRLQTDALTGLANREAFMLRLRDKIIHASREPGREHFAVLFIDLNRFKQINDQFGHSTGDRVLIEVAERLRSTVRSRDLVARLSGDEYVILLDQVDGLESLERVRQQIQAALTEPLEALGMELLVDTDFGGSVGEALFPDDGQDAEALLKKADRRMYSQKFSSRSDSRNSPLRRAHD